MAEVSANRAATAGNGQRVLFRYRALESATGRLRIGEQDGESAYAVRASLRRIGLEVQLPPDMGIRSGFFRELVWY